jgi:hypothetical protein
VGFYGWAQISGANNARVVAQVLETRADIGFVALVNAQAFNASGSSSNSSYQLYAPAIFNRAFGSFVTGLNLVNPNGYAVQASLVYYDQSGKAYPQAGITMQPYSILALFQGGSSSGLPVGFYGSAGVSSSGGSLVMVVNEAGGVTKSGSAESGTYAANRVGGRAVSLPVVANGGNGYTSGLTILNSSGNTVNGSISYYNADGSEVVSSGVSQSFRIGGHASQIFYQGGSSGLPVGYYGEAVIRESGGTGSDLIVTTNAQSDATFFTYTEPNQ